MTDPANTLNALAKEAHATAIAKGWYDRLREPPELLCLIHSELSECLEAFRNGNPMSRKIPHCPQVAEELADAIIRILDMAEHLNLDIGRAVVEKMAYNQTRPVRHGGKVY